MEISQKLLLFLFFSSFAAGMILGSVYDLFSFIRLLFGISRTSRKTAKKTAGHRLGLSLTFGMDLCFSLLCGVVLILLLYFLNDGVIRSLAPLGLGSGFFAYRATLGRLITRFYEGLANFIRRAIRLTLKALLKPIRACFGWAYDLLLTPLLYTITKVRDRRAIKRTLRTTESFIRDAGRSFTSNK